MREILLNAIAITLQNTIAKLGPIPDRHGHWIKADLENADPVMLPALGCYLEECIKEGNYDALEKASEARASYIARFGVRK